MRCVVLQPSYIPWRGYFHQIQKADVFVFYDDVQYDKHGWRNRNRIKTREGTRWLTVPVHTKSHGRTRLRINEIQIDGSTNWAQRHWRSLTQSYGKAPFFGRYAPLLEPIYRDPPACLADLDIALTMILARALGLAGARFVRSSALGLSGARMERLVSVLRAVGATRYVSGPAARAYLDEAELAREGIGLEYMRYDYPAYEQLHPPYDPAVSIVDLLFMEGPRAADFIWGAHG